MDEKSLTTDQIQSNFLEVKEKIERAARSCGRDPNGINLVVVSKQKSIETIQNAAKAGIRIFGENYADEAIPKIYATKMYPDLQWHMIGHIQSRKAKMVTEYFDYVHSLDSLKLAKRINKYAQDISKKMPTLIEFNISGEGSKYGFPAWKESAWPELLPSMEQILGFPNLIIQGMMSIPPYFTYPELSRPYFILLRKLQSYLKSNFPDANLSELSMGMSADFEIAIEEGATWIRVGQAILGERI